MKCIMGNAALFPALRINIVTGITLPAVCVGERDRGTKNQARMKDRSRLAPPMGEVRNFQKNSREYCDYECM